MPKRHRGWLIAGVILSVLILAAVMLASMAAEPVRRYIEGEANAALPGYHVTIRALDLHPLTLSVDLQDVVVRQDIHPEPPVLSIPHVIADAQLAPLFSGQVGADLHVETPMFAVNKKHVDGFFRRRDSEVVREAWQDRLREAVGFRGTFYLNNGQLTYDEGKPNSEPLRVDRIDVQVHNITNRPEENDEYPSKVHVSVKFPDESHVQLEGRANWLAIPVPRLDAEL